MGGVENIKDKYGNMRTQSVDIDVVALSEVDKKALVGECKFKNEKIDKSIYETLVSRGKLFLLSIRFRNIYYFH